MAHHDQHGQTIRPRQDQLFTVVVFGFVPYRNGASHAAVGFKLRNVFADGWWHIKVDGLGTDVRPAVATAMIIADTFQALGCAAQQPQPTNGIAGTGQLDQLDPPHLQVPGCPLLGCEPTSLLDAQTHHPAKQRDGAFQVGDADCHAGHAAHHGLPWYGLPRANSREG